MEVSEPCISQFLQTFSANNIARDKTYLITNRLTGFCMRATLALNGLK